MNGFATKKAYETYLSYIAIKRHFGTSYDYFKYNGKVNASYDKFVTRPDVYSFKKLSEKDSPKDILVANLLHTPNKWIMDIVSEDGISVYTKWRKNVESFSYLFTSDLEKLDDDYMKNFSSTRGSLPLLMAIYLEREITFETLTAISKISKIIPQWKSEVGDNFIAKEIITKIEKYSPFLNIDLKKTIALMEKRW